MACLIIALGLWQRSGPGQFRSKLPVGPVTPVVSVGAAHGLILAGDGSLWSWGSDFIGWPMLGTGTTNTNTQTFLTRIGRETNWVSISAGDSLSLAIKSDGSLWAWGENIYGEFGLGTKSIPPSSGVPIPAAPGNDWKAASAGGSHVIALKKNGTLWAWGINWAGQLGVGSTNDCLAPVQIGQDTNWIKAWAGGLRGAALKSDGSLWVWGDNPALTNQVPRTNANLWSPVRFSLDTNWVDACFGSDLLLAIKSDGSLWAWGRNAHYFTGVSNRTSAFTPARVGTNSDWKCCSSSRWTEYAVLRKKDGSIWTLSAPFFPSTGSARVTRIELPGDVIAVAGGGGGGHGRVFLHDSLCTGAALTRNGEVWTWGKTLGNHTPAPLYLLAAAHAARFFHIRNDGDDPVPVMHDQPVRLQNLNPDNPPK